jgi:hypothetical protein
MRPYTCKHSPTRYTEPKDFSCVTWGVHTCCMDERVSNRYGLAYRPVWLMSKAPVMPYKANARRHCIPKQQYRLTN